MKLMIESTEELVVQNGVPCRMWKGTTEGGAACLVFVHCVAVNPTNDASEFERHLFQMLPFGITEHLLEQSGATSDELGRYSWPPITEQDGLTYLSVVPLADGEWMLEITQSGRDAPEAKFHAAIGLTVSTMQQLLSLLQAVRGSLISSTVVQN